MNINGTPATADYIVVGGGTAGLVVANRLTEDPNVRVLVLEAGVSHLEDPRVQVPAFFTTLMGSEADFQYKTVPQPGLHGRQVPEPQGKLLGGSSGINGQAFIAPSKADIDAWAKIGNTGWDWSTLLPYFKKFYTLTPPPDQETRDHLGIDWLNEETRGTDGPVQVSFPGVIQNPMGKAWIDAFKAMNYNTTGDPFSGKSTGGYSNAATVDIATKTRSYAATAYGVPAMERPNFTVVTGAAVKRVVLAPGSLVSATAVEALVDGVPKTFVANKEVVLCAGVFNTPKLLELSGIGNPEILKKHGIEPVINNPGVGENLQDHLMTGVSFEVVNSVITGDPLMRQEPEALAAAQKLYAEHKAGPFTMGGMQSHAFMPVLEFVDTPGRKLQKELFDQYAPASGSKEAEYYGLVRDIIESPDEGSGAWFMFLAQANLHEHGKSFVGTQLQPENFASLGCSQCHPLSRGSTHIASPDVNATPDIDPRYFSHPIDLELMARHVQAMETLRQTPELAKFFKPDGKRNHPDAFHIKDLEGAKKYLLDTALTTYHTCGSAAMLPKEKGGVVDASLKVYGTANLRIVDASIFPLIPRNNIMSTVYAVAERAADIIKGR